MIRYKLHIFIATILSLTFAVYHFESEVNKLDLEINDKMELINTSKRDIEILEAEWSYQNNPVRLEKLSKTSFPNSVSAKMATPRLKHYTNLRNLENKRTYLSQNENSN